MYLEFRVGQHAQTSKVDITTRSDN